MFKTATTPNGIQIHVLPFWVRPNLDAGHGFVCRLTKSAALRRLGSSCSAPQLWIINDS